MLGTHDLWNRETKIYLAAALLVGLLLRLFFVIYLPATDVDSELYEELGQNVVLNHAYAYQPGTSTGLVPTDARVPGYPLFLGAIYIFFGDSQRAVLIAQVFVDLGACVLIAMLAGSIAPRRSRKPVTIAALWLGATCPFVANYAAIALTEVLTTFFAAGALLLVVWADQSESESTGAARKLRSGYLWLLGGLMIGLGSLVRPETPIMLAAPAIVLAVRWYKPVNWPRLARAGLLLVVGTLIPLLPWAARNWITLHKVQFLTQRYFQLGDGYIPVGFYAWTHTWMVSYDSVDTVFNRIDDASLNITDFPAYAFDSAEERARVDALLEEQQSDSFMASPEADAQFAELARERTARHPLRTYVTVPLRRCLALWFTRRTELLPYAGYWWPPIQRWRLNKLDFMVGLFSTALNFLYAGLALAGAYAMRRRRGVALLAAFIVARTVFIAFEHLTVEPRFVLPCMPAVLALGALAWAKRADQESPVN